MPKSTNPTTRIVLKYMRNHAGEVMHYADVAADLSLEESTVNASMARMVLRHPEYGVVREGSGQYVFYKSREGAEPVDVEPERTGPMMYEEVGQTSAGVIIVRDEKGVLYSLGAVL